MSGLRIGALDLEWANPGEPMVCEKYYIQREQPNGIWVDARIDVNMNGAPNLGVTQGILARTRDGYCDETRWRIVRRTCTVETEVALPHELL